MSWALGPTLAFPVRGSFYREGQVRRCLSSKGLSTRHSAEPRGLELLACIPASLPLLSGSRVLLDSGKPQSTTVGVRAGPSHPPPGLNRCCTPLTLLCNDISVLNAKPHAHTHAHIHAHTDISAATPFNQHSPPITAGSLQLYRLLCSFR